MQPLYGTKADSDQNMVDLSQYRTQPIFVSIVN